MYTWIVSHHPTKPDAEPRVVVLVELDDGIRFVANLLGVEPDDVQNGMEVALSIEPDRRRRAPAVPPGGVAVSASSSETAIVGIGQTEFSKHSGRSELQLAGEAVTAAVADAGLTPRDIDGAVTFAIDVNDELAVMRCRGHPGAAVHRPDARRWRRRVRDRAAGVGGRSRRAQPTRSSCTARSTSGRDAASASRSRERQGAGRHRRDGTGTCRSASTRRRRCTRSGTSATCTSTASPTWTSGCYPVVARKHAATNPNAFYYQQPLTLEDHQQSRWIVEPILRKLDCCQESDGGVALVVTSMDRARDLPHAPVRVAAASQAPPARRRRDVRLLPRRSRGDYEEAAFLGQQLYEATGLAPDDIDVAMIYENFTPIVFLQLEAFGFCGPGEATDFIADGNIEVGGKIPVNPNGGLLGEAYIHGMNNILEGVRQVRGTAANQVDDAEHVLVSAGRSGLVLSP